MNAAIVIPCYNEENRLDVAEMHRLASIPGIAVVFVDDGSTDRTADLLRRVVAVSSGGASLVQLSVNGGKAEAVRAGLIEAMRNGAPVIGFADADLATPVNELTRLSTLAHKGAADVVLAARVKLAGRAVERHAGRHYVGRIIATYLAIRTHLPVYDTQCGAKFFRTSRELRMALADPFGTRWLFDVELLRRLHDAHQRTGRRLHIREEPLEAWEDVGETHLKGGEVLRVMKDFAALERQLRRVAPAMAVNEILLPEGSPLPRDNSRKATA